MRAFGSSLIGIFVMHPHRLDHEDNGLMMRVNVIAAVSTYAVAVPNSPGKPTEVPSLRRQQ
ncbi:hypothetical protein [Chelatococcus reniformis]|uniref:Uncharacterized protein n=1 Tax=Chelatococcus reniformis TaxID=1494448 RepID=A0A916UVM6_9HYPH|nr:hypothetical protein [Chelatococcus reniformis]GGC89853.1 hypothetical protein GCM10010994_54630 [Chelatococcus reniformis]